MQYFCATSALYKLGPHDADKEIHHNSATTNDRTALAQRQGPTRDRSTQQERQLGFTKEHQDTI